MCMGPGLVPLARCASERRRDDVKRRTSHFATKTVHAGCAEPHQLENALVLNGCRVVANPRGYVDLREDGGFNPALV
jgi:hypothetical protein